MERDFVFDWETIKGAMSNVEKWTKKKSIYILFNVRSLFLRPKKE